jgi:molybdate transport repressor ModE-like protein
MLKFAIKPLWVLRDHEDGEHLLPPLIPLLSAIHETGSLAKACEAVGHSYRHAWGLLQEARQVFGAPLVASTRGRGAALTGLGERLLWADKRIHARLGPTLEALASEIEAEIERASPDSRGVLRIHASHAFALTALRDFLTRRHIAVEISYEGSSNALASLHHAGCDAAGFHVPIGELASSVLPLYGKWLNPAVHVLVNVVERRQGIIVAAGNPKGITSIADLARPRIRFVNRQPGSGTRIILDLLLAKERIPESRIDGYDRSEYTHAAVAAHIASGMADAGVGVETAARQFNLGFVPLLTERYFLAARREALESPLFERVLDAMRSREFRAQIVKLQGLDPGPCGTIQEIADALPALVPRARRRKAMKASG